MSNAHVLRILRFGKSVNKMQEEANQIDIALIDDEDDFIEFEHDCK